MMRYNRDSPTRFTIGGTQHMQRSRIFVVLAALSMFVVATPAQAQFGGLKNAIKKKAKEAINGKDTTAADASSTNAAQPSNAPAPSRAPTRLDITTDVIAQFQKGLNAEAAKRAAYVKRSQCEKQAQGTPEFMNVMAANGPEMEKVQNSSMSDDQKMAAMQKLSLKLKADADAFVTKRCGEVVPQLNPQEYDAVGAEAAGLERAQYAMLKERVRPYCEGIAKGGSGANKPNIVYTDAEMAALKPQCASLLPVLRKTS